MEDLELAEAQNVAQTSRVLHSVAQWRNNNSAGACVEDKDLIAIERRMNAYPLEARHDIAQLLGELRRLRQIPASKAPQNAASHLYDAQTGLLNAGAYGVRFAMARARATRYRKLFAVMSLDFADAALEAAGGSEMLHQAARRLQGCVRATDTLARIGETNFAVIVEDLTQPDQAERVKQQVRDALRDLSPGSGEAPVDIRLEFFPGRQQTSGQRLAS